MTFTPTAPSFGDLLNRAVTEPGIVSAAYSCFHHFSLGNQLLAWAQCLERGIQPGPLATYPKWRALGRHVKRGETAITLCQPVTVKRHTQADNETEDTAAFTRFIYKPHWFVLAQTDGQPLPTVTSPTWDRRKALAVLNVTEVPFAALDGNVMGFARGRNIAVSPLNPMPPKTTFHEVAHILLGHTADADQNDDELPPKDLCECEAEAVALLCCAALDLPGVEFARGYIQGWWGTGNPIPERSAQRILTAADQILKAGATDATVSAVAA